MCPIVNFVSAPTQNIQNPSKYLNLLYLVIKQAKIYNFWDQQFLGGQKRKYRKPWLPYYEHQVKYVNT